MPRTKVMLPEGFVEEYLKCQNLTKLARKYNVSEKTIQARLIEKGIIVNKHNNRGSLRRDLSKELTEKRRINTEMNNKYFAKNNVQGKKYHLSRMQAIGYHRT